MSDLIAYDCPNCGEQLGAFEFEEGQAKLCPHCNEKRIVPPLLPLGDPSDASRTGGVIEQSGGGSGKVVGVIVLLLLIGGGAGGYALWKKNPAILTGKSSDDTPVLTAEQIQAAGKARRALTALNDGHAKTAKDLAEEAMAVDDTLPEAYTVLIALRLTKRDYATAVDLLIGMDTKCKTGITTLPDLPNAADFAKSDEYQRWQKHKLDKAANAQ